MNADMPKEIWSDSEDETYFDAALGEPDILLAKTCTKYIRADLVISPEVISRVVRALKTVISYEQTLHGTIYNQSPYIEAREALAAVREFESNQPAQGEE